MSAWRGVRCRYPRRSSTSRRSMETLTTLESLPATLSLSAEERALLCARVADDNKAKNIVVLDMRGITPLYDYMVLMTGISRRQMHTLAEEVDAAMRTAGD